MKDLIESINSINATLNDYTGDIITAIIGAIPVILGIIVATPLLRKKLVEDHIKKRLEQIQDCNIEFAQKAFDIINKYTLRSDNQIISTIEARKFYIDELLPLSSISQKASKEISTGFYYVQMTVNRLLKYCDKDRSFLPMNFFNVICSQLEHICYYSRKAIPVPRGGKLQYGDPGTYKTIKRGPSKNFKINKLKYFEDGIDYDPRYYIAYDLYRHIFSSDEKWNKAFFRVVEHKIQIFTSELLSQLKVIAPLYFYINDKAGNEKLPRIYLVGIQSKRTFSVGDPIGKVYYHFIYCNETEWYQFINIINIQMMRSEKIVFDTDEIGKWFANQISSIGYDKDLQIITFKIPKDRFDKIDGKLKRLMKKKIYALHVV